jgi:hypothetical protein
MSDTAAVQARELHVPLNGPSYERAVVLAVEAVTAIVYGGPAGEGALEFVLTEAANNRQVSAALTLLLAQMAAASAGLAAELDDGPDDPDSIRIRTVSLVEEIAGSLSRSTSS